MSQQKKGRKANPKPKSRIWLILLIVAMALALVGGMQARTLLSALDLSGVSKLLPQMPASSADVVSAAVEGYAQNGDLNQARTLLAGIDNAEVARQLTSMEINSTDTATRQKVGTLRRALGLPVVEPSAADLVLGQQSIWMTSAIAALPFLAALALWLGSSVRTMVSARLEEARTTRVTARPAAQAQVIEVEPEAPVEPAAEQKAAEAQAQAAQATAAKAAAAAKPKEEKPATSLLSNPTADPMGGGEVSAAMQGILSDVFGDESQQSRRTVLLQGLGDIPASDLLAACRRIADGLRMNRSGVRH